MRTSIGPALVIVNLATVVILVLLLLQTTALRGDLDEARAELAAIEAQVVGQDEGVPVGELSTRLTELEGEIQDLVVAVNEDASAGAGGSGSESEVLGRLDEVLDRIEALDARVDEICENVPVC